MLVAPTPRVFSPSQMTTVDTTKLHSNTTQIEQDPLHLGLILLRMKVLTKMLKVTGLELQKVTRPIKNQSPF